MRLILPLMYLAPNATSDEFATGDVLVAQVHYPGGEEREVTYALETVFATYPLIASYTDELGTTREVPYPPPPNDELLPALDGPDADSDVEVTLNFWRPQRRAIPEEAQSGTEWIDIGGLQYYTNANDGPPGAYCPESSLTESDPDLSLGTGKVGGGQQTDGILTDSAPDQPASPTNTFTYTLNLSDCLAASGTSFQPPPQPGGDSYAYFNFGADTPHGL